MERQDRRGVGSLGTGSIKCESRSCTALGHGWRRCASFPILTARMSSDHTATAAVDTLAAVAAPAAADPQPVAAAASAANPAATHTGVDGRGILISDAAMRQLAQLIRQQGDNRVLRVGVRSGGCSGMSYTMDFVPDDQIRPNDEIYNYEPADAPAFRVVSDPKSLLYIYGMQLDFSSALIGGGFNFSNPNASQTCGCGSSFAV